LRTTLWMAVLATAILSSVFAAPAAAGGPYPNKTPQTLTGEVLLASEIPGPGTSTFSGTCDPLGNSTFQFTVTGLAEGPYPGTFTESGTITFGPFGVVEVGFGVAAFNASFTIQSAVGTVTGTKTLATPNTGFGACGVFAFPTGGIDFEGNVVYQAQITTPGGSATDSGTSFVNYGDTGIRGVPGFNGFNFDESFTSTSTPRECEEDVWHHRHDDDCED
jgi:hypothetical protein